MLPQPLFSHQPAKSSKLRHGKRGEAVEREADIRTLEGLLVPGPGLPSGAGTGLLLIPTPWVPAMAASVSGQPPAPTLLRPCPKPLRKLHRQEWVSATGDKRTPRPVSFGTCFPELLATGDLEPEGPGRRYRGTCCLLWRRELDVRVQLSLPAPAPPTISAWAGAQPGLRKQAPLPPHCSAALDSLQGGNSEVSIKCKHP